jgi:hypothetical protein
MQSLWQLRYKPLQQHRPQICKSLPLLLLPQVRDFIVSHAATLAAALQALAAALTSKLQVTAAAAAAAGTGLHCQPCSQAVSWATSPCSSSTTASAAGLAAVGVTGAGNGAAAAGTGAIHPPEPDRVCQDREETRQGERTLPFI